MRRPLVAGNWKMHGSLAMAGHLAGTVAAAVPADVETLLCPPAPYLAAVGAALAGSTAVVGGQDCSEHEAGAYTGEVAADMLVDLGCKYVLIGHSERRQYFGDTDQRVAAKTTRALASGLCPVVCVGETLAERQAGRTEQVIRAQLEAVVTTPEVRAGLARIVIAYEPVWAIGTGETASPAQAQAVHAQIRAQIAEHDRDCAAGLRILYGGSVKPDNAAALFAETDIDGGLIGGASLDAAAFIAICQAAR